MFVGVQNRGHGAIVLSQGDCWVCDECEQQHRDQGLNTEQYYVSTPPLQNRVILGIWMMG